MVAAVRADDLIQVGVAAFETAVRDAGRLAPQDRPSAVAGLTAGGAVTTAWGTMRSRRSRRSRGCGAGTAAGPALVMMSGSLELLT